jgi:hypothetical protein
MNTLHTASHSNRAAGMLELCQHMGAWEAYKTPKAKQARDRSPFLKEPHTRQQHTTQVACRHTNRCCCCCVSLQAHQAVCTSIPQNTHAMHTLKALLGAQALQQQYRNTQAYMCIQHHTRCVTQTLSRACYRTHLDTVHALEEKETKHMREPQLPSPLHPQGCRLCNIRHRAEVNHTLQAPKEGY